MDIKSTDETVGGLLTRNFFKVPRFQRPYSWDLENVQDFWEDTIQESEGDFFIGSIVVFPFDKETIALVDGQQRFTTITMILCALRDAMQAAALVDPAAGIHGKFVERPDLNSKQRYVLDTETPHPYFHEHVLKPGDPDVDKPVSDEEKAIERANNWLREQVEAVVESIRSDPTIKEEKKAGALKKKLEQIRDKLLELKLIFVRIENEEDSYEIFETLNTRGKDLEVSDLTKNHLLRLMKAKGGVDVPRSRWNKLRESFEKARINLNGFLLHFWLSRHEYVSRQKLFKSMKRRIKKANAGDYLKLFEQDSNVYKVIHAPATHTWTADEDEIRLALQALRIFGVVQPMPYVLATLREYLGKRLSRKNTEQALRAVENFHFMFTAVMSYSSSGGVSRMYAKHAKQVTDAPDANAKRRAIQELTTKLRDRLPEEDEFVASFSDLKYGREVTRDKKLVKYILGRVDRLLYRGVKPDFDLMTIEHLSPENPEEGESELDPDKVTEIGNLMLVTQELNDKLANKPFEEKKPILEASSLELRSSIKSATSWGETEISNESTAMAKLAYRKVWKI